MAHMMISTRRWKSLGMYIHSINYRYIYAPRKSLSKQIRYKNVYSLFSCNPSICFLSCVSTKRYLTNLVALLRVNLIDRFTSLPHPPDILNQQIRTHIKVPFYIRARMWGDDDLRVRI